jgi:hypothetical protein
MMRFLIGEEFWNGALSALSLKTKRREKVFCLRNPTFRQGLLISMPPIPCGNDVIADTDRLVDKLFHRITHNAIIYTWDKAYLLKKTPFFGPKAEAGFAFYAILNAILTFYLILKDILRLIRLRVKEGKAPPLSGCSRLVR